MSVKEKKEFLRWFITHAKFSRREIYWIINYLESHESILENVHFVEHANKTPRGILFATTEQEFSKQIVLFKDKQEFLDVDQIFHEIRLNWRENLYIEVLFENAWSNEKYLKVLEDNPFSSWNEEVDEEISEEIEHYFSEQEVLAKKQLLYDKINEALDKGDEQEFQKLSHELQEMN
ncbi:Uncharacterized protein YpiB, UPF0302 family [Pilibacter termitis]|uniref:Uncharacterized protein YpiB, UPF0302 family n=1 Tax=Pilibacter termitis TaxID=263852 RepID=A0A1T4M651_9ENTE|nr:YpiB family protein [Pilibacter termitis]SJZ62479.1 Uncharacterized protein YpiB, UPF0302 family [Pilibacter termitis]